MSFLSIYSMQLRQIQKNIEKEKPLQNFERGKIYFQDSNKNQIYLNPV